MTNNRDTANRLEVKSSPAMFGKTKSLPKPLAALTPTQRVALNEVTQLLRERLSVERIVLYFPKDQDGENPSTLHLAVVTDHYPTPGEYRAALEIFEGIRSSHNVTIRSVFTSCQDWEEFFPQIAAFEEIRQQGIEIWCRAWPYDLGWYSLLS